MEFLASEPPDRLVGWACAYEHILHLRQPADRPWYVAPPPPGPCLRWEYLCRCLHARVQVVGYDSDAENVVLYVGQCPRCQAILWSVLGPIPAGNQPGR